MPECKHELEVSQCFDCKPRTYTGPFWDAKYESVCTHPSCLKIIERGERVRWDDTGTTAIHAKHK